ncbi:GDSL-like Lipase/Acylhydrolase superfamily protein [Striga asiatica]|uniref:GDSL-like Lipase/Acylhydrolase superfamily protein n=1 Tax=Striga asiatica TaxID=4170 RepID=A0A5A7PNA7_STRAF|nr:GDSL-like Lipase/Acylhydrolase superfamily protein [Striga asiatica]
MAQHFAKFWWNQGDSTKQGLHWKSWNHITLPKDRRGQAFWTTTSYCQSQKSKTVHGSGAAGSKSRRIFYVGSGTRSTMGIWIPPHLPDNQKAKFQGSVVSPMCISSLRQMAGDGTKAFLGNCFTDYEQKAIMEIDNWIITQKTHSSGIGRKMGNFQQPQAMLHWLRKNGRT